jgi:hypothetical protein
MRSTAPRFADSHQQGTPFGAYNIDAGSKKSVESDARGKFALAQPVPSRPSTPNAACYESHAIWYCALAADNRRFYASVFQSNSPRFPKPSAGQGATDAIYDPVLTKSAGPATTEKSLQSSPNSYAILRSRYKRFNDKSAGEVRKLGVAVDM